MGHYYIGLLLLWEKIVKIVNGERLGYKKPTVNCAGCEHKVGRVCAYHHAVLQSNQHRPTDCKDWIPKVYKDD